MFAKNIMFLDLGYSLKGMVINEKKFKILAKATQENSGISNGYITNTEIFQTSLKMLIKTLEKKTKSKISSTVLLVGGKLVSYKLLVSNEIKIGSIIDKEKMNLIDLKIKKWIDENQSLLIRSNPIEYKIDGISTENPFGMYADALQFTYFLAYAKMNVLGNIVYLLEKQGLDIIDIIPSIYCAAALNLHEDEKTLGSLIFDCGANNINWACYLRNKPIAAGSIQIGSEILTNKIAKSLKISINEARKLKHKHAAAQLSSENFCIWVEFIKDGNTEYMLESEIVRKIIPEVRLITDEIQKIIAHFSSKAHLAVLCGNAAWLNKFNEVLQKGISTSIKLIPSTQPEYDALNGTIIALQNEMKKKEKNILQKASHWLKENL